MVRLAAPEQTYACGQPRLLDSASKVNSPAFRTSPADTGASGPVSDVAGRPRLPQLAIGDRRVAGLARRVVDGVRTSGALWLRVLHVLEYLRGQLDAKYLTTLREFGGPGRLAGQRRTPARQPVARRGPDRRLGAGSYRSPVRSGSP